MSKYRAGVLYGDEILALYEDAKQNCFALPAVNISGTNSINACMETAARVNSPIIIQCSNGGADFIAGRSLHLPPYQSNIQGAVSMALLVHNMATYYGISVVLHTDHASRHWLPWVDGLLTCGQKFYRENGYPLFSSHMLDLSEEPLESIIETAKPFLKRCATLQMGLEVELGITGGEEDGVDHSSVDESRLYSQPEDIWNAFSSFSAISPLFTIAAAFGNVHGVYKPGNVHLRPEILKRSQIYIAEKLHLDSVSKPVSFVFHGGSGSEKEKIKESLNYGVVKMNIDTDTQWAFWNGILKYYQSNEAFLQSQLGNPLGIDAPNKKYYDPRQWLRAGEISFSQRLEETFIDLNAINRNA